MTREEAIDWLRLLKHEDIEFDDYSEDTKELRERAIGCFQEALDLGIQVLENQKTGHWVDCGDRDLWYRCSECGKRMWSGNCYNYCPNCGAKMVYSQEREE